MECPACRAQAPEGSRFCPSCGQPLETRVDERRVATVLFADLVGYTGLSEGRDPEQVKNLVDRCFERLVADVVSYGGRVDKIMGDALVALFGAPIAHEDDAERAVRAALQMQQTLQAEAGRLDVPVRMRIGINTGEVLVGALRAGGDYTAMGDAVNVASRLQVMADPGSVVVGSATHTMTADVVRYQPLGSVAVRNREEPVEAWIALEAVAPPGHRPRRLRAPLVGRDTELSLLRSALATAVQRRRPQVVHITGEAGMGKSRVAEELCGMASSDCGAAVLEGRCVPYGEANVWWPIAAAVRQAVGIERDDGPDVATQRCREVAAAGMGRPVDDAKVVRVAEGLLWFLGVPGALADVEAARARDDAVRSLVALVRKSAEHKPIVLLFSELHWADDLVLELLDQLPDRLSGLPVIIVMTARPDLEERWRPRTGRHNLVALHLDPLDRRSATTLLAALLESEPDPALADALFARSGGNPFFLEELASLVRPGSGLGVAGIDAIGELPVTLRGLLATRLDSLPPAERRVIDDAAVVGPVGTVKALSALRAGSGSSVPAVLEALAARDLIAMSGGDWSFRTELLREVAYETLSKAERARRHATLAAWLETSDGDGERVDGAVLEQVAHHYGAAADLVAELGPLDGVPDDVRTRALEWTERAARRAEHRETHAATIALLDRSIALLPRGRERRDALVRRARARAALRQTEQARADVTLVLEESGDGVDPANAAHALTVLGLVEQNEGQLNESAATLDEAVSRWREIGDRAGEADALRIRGMTEMFRGRLDEAEQWITDALELFRSLGDRRGEAWGLQNLAWIAFTAGDIATAHRRVVDAMEMFTDLADWGGRSWAAGLLAWVQMQLGHLDEADTLGEEVLGEAMQSGDRWAEGMMSLLLASTRLWTGRSDDAVERALQSRAIFADLGDVEGEMRAIGPLSRALIAAGRVSEGLAALADAAQLAQRLDGGGAGRQERLVAAFTAAQVGDGAGALEAASAVVPRPEGDPDVDTAIGLGLLLTGNADEGARRLQRAVTATTAPGPRTFAGASLVLAQAAAGRPAEALAAAADVDRSEGTYLDHLTLGYGTALAALQLGDRERARDEIDAAVALADSTQDRLSQALARLARSALAAATGDDDAAHRREEAVGRLRVTGAAGTGWDAVFRAAAGVSA
jgi:class 3 adenylate cyclase/tetratricopeptide (TPR) repeat protein